MTAYSRASRSSSLGRFVIELHSVNRKMLDMSIYLPKDFLCFDVDIRKWLSQQLERGQVTLRLTIQNEGVSHRLFSHYAVQLRNFKEAWEKIARELNYDPKEAINFPFLVAQIQAMTISDMKEEEGAIQTTLHEVIKDALCDLMKMKEIEGQALALDIQKRLKAIEENITAIESKKEEPVMRYRKKLMERLKEMNLLHGDAEDRILREVVLLAERMDITEELVRLRGHTEQFHRLLFSPEKAVGRTLDFLTQEMHREINTLGAKSSDNHISLFVVKIKSELDKIREQVQNIE